MDKFDITLEESLAEISEEFVCNKNICLKSSVNRSVLLNNSSKNQSTTLRINSGDFSNLLVSESSEQASYESEDSFFSNLGSTADIQLLPESGTSIVVVPMRNMKAASL